MHEKLDSINIEVIVEAVQLDSVNIWMQGDLEIQINGKKPCGENDIINIDILIKSLESDGEYYIFSCNCGVPKCSGWIHGIDVKHKENTVIWTNINTKESWVLDRQKIENDLKDIREEVKNYKLFFTKKQIKYVGVGYNW